jgi:hypothetical protein
MEKNKTGKYLKYAIGEIILVVIGILVAIQLNEWRLESNNDKQKQIILNALQLEFEANLQQLDTVIYYIEEVPKAYLLANEMMKKSLKKYSENDYSKLVVGLGWTYTFNPSNGALRSAISSSEIHLIENKRLIEILFSWEDVIKDSEEEALTIRKFQYESLVMKGKYISATSEWKAIFPEMLPPNNPSDFIGLLQDKGFENYSVRSYSYAKEYLDELNDIKDQNMEILLLIEQEIKK